MPAAAHPVRQRGQALPFAVFLLIASTAVMLFSLNAGQVTVEKTRITNAADAAAYSAGVTLARALNYGGYTNRAMIANEVAVAQAVSAASWTNYALNTMTVGPRERIAFRVGWVIPADDMSRWLQLEAAFIGGTVADYYSGGSFSEGAERFAQLVNVAAGAIVGASSVAAHALSASQTTLYATLAADVALGDSPMAAAARQVAQTMDPAFETQIVPASVTALGFVRRYSDGDRARTRDTVMASLDEFTRGRNWDIRQQVPLTRARIERRGSTMMTDDFEGWVSQDSMVARWRTLTWRGWRDREEQLAESAVVAGTWDAQSSNTITDYAAEFGAGASAYLGLPAYFDLHDLSAAAGTDSTGLTILVEKARAALQTSGNALQARQEGRLDLYQGEPLAGRLAALSRVEVYFARPTPRADGRDELASLFNPFWEVRLVQPNAVDRAFMAARQGLESLP